MHQRGCSGESCHRPAACCVEVGAACFGCTPAWTLSGSGADLGCSCSFGLLPPLPSSELPAGRGSQLFVPRLFCPDSCNLAGRLSLSNTQSEDQGSETTALLVVLQQSGPCTICRDGERGYRAPSMCPQQTHRAMSGTSSGCGSCTHHGWVAYAHRSGTSSRHPDCPQSQESWICTSDVQLYQLGTVKSLQEDAYHHVSGTSPA